MILNISNADRIVNRWQRQGINVEWDGWVLQFLKATPRAEFSPRAIRQRGQFGYPVRIEPNRKGKWFVPQHYLVSTVE